jgi:hypothetical protein
MRLSREDALAIILFLALLVLILASSSPPLKLMYENF